MSRVEHWNGVYQKRAVDELSWFQSEAQVSLELIDHGREPPTAAIVDIGAGASTLVDGLLARGYGDITLLDIAPAALAATRERLPDTAAVHYEVGDITTWRPERSFRLWHDRAVFHFLTDAKDREAYRSALAAALAPGAHAVIATFAADGPERCSGLPVQRYSADALAAEFSRELRAIESRGQRHRTPSGSEQSFVFVRFERR